MADEQDRESTLTEIIARIEPAKLNQDDHAILLRLVQTLDEVERLYLEYEFNSVLPPPPVFLERSLRLVCGKLQA